jgi:hypothetical protein
VVVSAAQTLLLGPDQRQRAKATDLWMERRAMFNRFHRRPFHFEQLEDRRLLNADPGTIAPIRTLEPAAPNVTGRITAIAVDPSDPSGNTVYVSAANGGVWKTTGTPGPDDNTPGPDDSIWIDNGFPVVTTAAGQTYKPLFAFYVEDLDGQAVDPNNPHHDFRPIAFLGGVFVAAGDVNGDGFADIISARGIGEPQLRVFDGASGLDLSNFFAEWPQFAGGGNVALGDVNTDGFDGTVTGAGPGAGPHIKIFDAATLRAIDSFFTSDPS